ncbi:TPA: hypothetical protein ACN983_003452 [Vibrio parahaemolyticus]
MNMSSMPKGYEDDEVKLALNGLLCSTELFMTMLTDPLVKQHYENDYRFLCKCLKTDYQKGKLTKDRLVRLAKQERRSLRDQANELELYVLREEINVQAQQMPMSYLLNTITPSIFSMHGHSWCDPTLMPPSFTSSLDGILHGEEGKDRGRDNFVIEGEAQNFKLYYYFSLDTSKRSIPMNTKPLFTSMNLYGSHASPPPNDAVTDRFTPSLKQILSKSLKDGVYVWIETLGVGHTFIAVFKEKKPTLYSYGRYGDDGKKNGVLLIYNDQAAYSYMKEQLYTKNANVYYIANADVNKLSFYFTQKHDYGRDVVNTYTKDTATKERLKTFGKVIDNYELTSNNCTTHSVESLIVSGIPFDPTITIPLSFKNILSQSDYATDVTSAFYFFYSYLYENKKSYPSIEDVVTAFGVKTSGNELIELSRWIN